MNDDEITECDWRQIFDLAHEFDPDATLTLTATGPKHSPIELMPRPLQIEKLGAYADALALWDHIEDQHLDVMQGRALWLQRHAAPVDGYGGYVIGLKRLKYAIPPDCQVTVKLTLPAYPLPLPVHP